MFEVVTQRFALLKPYQRGLVSGIIGFICYGCWAYFVNHKHGMMVAIKATYVQGSYSFVLTFFMTSLIEIFFRLFSHLLNNYILIIWTTILLTCCLIFGASWWVNVEAHTPEILETVSLGYVMGGIYTIVYVYSLAQTSEQQNQLKEI